GTTFPNVGVSSNAVQGNYVGTNAGGTAAVGNTLSGVVIKTGSQNNLVGTDGDGVNDAAEGNLISGNQVSGVVITGPGTSQNRVAGNLIGTDRTGTRALANQGDGGSLGSEAHDNRIGTDGDGVADALERNVISGNRVHGIRIDNADLNVVAGNSVGSNSSGTAALGNGAAGILIHNGAQGNLIGGAAS